ncbi:abortive infection family protein [Amycolatopsis sp. NPDC051071]|uniref:abortive infection family protein n=1 Tax=Amycolatopsis sp. NPDC051071 TaxID=3154637 RepID=UPI003423FD5E
MTDSTVGAIGSAFRDEGFAPNPDTQYSDSSVRRTATQEYLDSVAWSDPGHVARACRVFERLLTDWPDGPYLQRFYSALRRDGCTLAPDGLITPPTSHSSQRSLKSMASLTDPSAIQEQLDRIQRAIIDDPAQAIGSAKELIESTAKVVLVERGRPVNEKDDLPALARAAQDALGLHPSSATRGPDGSDAVKKILGAVTTIAAGFGELRNRGYGTGHGPAAARTGLHLRHAHLAVNAAVTWCQLLLDTLADPEAPWHKNP